MVEPAAQKNHLDSARSLFERLESSLAQVVWGKPKVLKKLALAVFVGGHVLFEDVPGVGKTTAAKALARTLSSGSKAVRFQRIQFTPDLLPYDITGVDVFHPETKSFEFKPGPVFAQIVLADEINRATPKVQSALLEVMEEGQVTVGGVTRPVGPFFFVVATQNPIDMDGTYPLPAAQLDRFLFKLSMGYPDLEHEARVWLGDPSHQALQSLVPSVDVEEIVALRPSIDRVHVEANLLKTIGRLITRTRDHANVALGLSVRSGVHLVRALRGWALLHGRDYVVDQDLKDLAVETFAHRIVLRQDRHTANEIVQRFLEDELEIHERA